MIEFREAIFNCLKNFGDYKKLKHSIVDLHKVYVNVQEKEDDLEIKKKQTEQRRRNLEKEGKIEKGKELKVTESRRKAGQ